jgi:hypothetical protein
MELPVYYDAQYDCQMEVLKFYSWAPNPRFAPWIDQMKEELSQISIVARQSVPEELPLYQPENWRASAHRAKTA